MGRKWWVGMAMPAAEELGDHGYDGESIDSESWSERTAKYLSTLGVN